MAEAIFNTKKFYQIDELKSLGYSHYKINQLVGLGSLSKLNKKTYENLNYVGEDSDYLYAHAYIPGGIICMMSAAVYHGLSTYRPESVDVAISRKARVSTLPEWPEITLHYFTDIRFEKGIETINQSGNVFKIYDMEKTVCDIVFYRKIVGIEETKEILKNYLGKAARNLNKLIHYAQELKCEEILKTYLEVLL